MKILSTAIFLLLPGMFLSAQEMLLNDQHLVEKINSTLDLIYNFEFDQAYKEISYLEDQLGDHPVNHILHSTILYWRDRPFKVDSGPYTEYLNELEKAIELATPFLEDEKLQEEGEFYILAGYGLLTDFYNEAGYKMKAVSSAKKAYNSLKKGFDLKEKFPDFYFSSGVYNYYREKFPELHPFYKAFLWLFVNGNMELGLEQLKIAAKRGIFTQREALIYLFHLYLRYENNPEAALPYTQILTERFPGNDKFKCLHVEALIYNKNDSIPEDMIDSLVYNDKILYQLIGNLFKGIIAEQNNEILKAQSYLESAMDLYEKMDREYDHYLSLIYTGMARVAIRQNDNINARNFYKLAVKSDPYVPVKEEAENFLTTSDDG
jgi:hypothetical protein